MAKVLGFPQKTETEQMIEKAEKELRDSIIKTLDCREKYERISGRMISWEILNRLMKAEDRPF